MNVYAFEKVSSKETLDYVQSVEKGICLHYVKHCRRGESLLD